MCMLVLGHTRFGPRTKILLPNSVLGQIIAAKLSPMTNYCCQTQSQDRILLPDFVLGQNMAARFGPM